MNIGKEEHWRLRLLELQKALAVSQKAMADTTGIDPSYLSRLLYPPGKKGRKNLGLETMASFRKGYQLSAGWFDLPLGSELPGTPTAENSPAFLVMEEATPIPAHKAKSISWPFQLASYRRLQDLCKALGPRLGQEAIADIDKHLDIVLQKWEGEVAPRKSRVKS
jgi:transcriptional regulator with XRE-family HTH domain